MTNRKTTRRALVLSLLSLLLCCSMLVGTTFAWFTDSVTSGKNQIVAGNLDIELKYSKDFTTWSTVEGASDLVDPNALWEPGRTEVVYLQLTNVGTLGLKYSFAMTIADAVNGISVEGNDIALADYLKYDIVEVSEAYTSRDAAREAVEATAQTLDNYGDEGTMLPNDSKTVALVVYMPEEVGNEANYRGEAIPSIELGLRVMATQLTYEEDSFDENYDKDADLISVVVTNEAELVEALANAKNGDVIGISGNVTWTTSDGNGKSPFVTDATNITLKGVGAGATFTATGKGVGAVGKDNGTVTFKNLTINDESKSYAESSWEYGYLEFTGNTVFENCDVVKAIFMQGKSATFKNCTFNSNADNEYAVWVYRGNASFTDCSFSGARGLKVHEAYGSEVGTVTVKNSKFAPLSKKPGVAIGDVNADTTITLEGNLFAGTQAGEQGNYKYETDTDVTTFNFTDKDNTVAEAASTAGELSTAIANANSGDTVVLTGDINVGANQFALEKDVTIDLNGNELTTNNNYGGMSIKNGASIKNGVINHTGNTAAIKIGDKAGTIENVTINITPTTGKTKTGIQVYNGKYVEAIKNVTITGATQGIEVANGSRVDYIEDVVVEDAQYALLINGGYVGKAVNCSFAGEYGVFMRLKGEYQVGLEMVDCTATGSTAALAAYDEAGVSNTTNCSLTLTYDAATKLNGAFVWEFEDECLGVVTLNKP